MECEETAELGEFAPDYDDAPRRFGARIWVR
jgi:hypothetical protein